MGCCFIQNLLNICIGGKIQINLNKLGLNESDPMTVAADQKDFFFKMKIRSNTHTHPEHLQMHAKVQTQAYKSGNHYAYRFLTLST